MIKSFDEIRLNTEFNTFHTIQEAIYESLRKAILNRQLPVGERLVEKHLAEAFCVSRTPVRKALKKLGDEGLVEFAGRQGVTVSHLTKADVLEIFKLRDAFEGLILEAVCKNADNLLIERLINEVKNSQLRYEKGDIRRVKHSFEKLHTMLVETAQMPRTAMMLVQMVDYLEQFRSIAVSHPDRCMEAIQEHERIVYALSHYEIKEAQKQNKVHLHNAREIMLCSISDHH